MKKQIVLLAAAAFLVSTVACSVSDETLNNADKRLKELKSKGLPDSVLSQPQVHLYQARECKRKNAWSEARAAAKLLKKELVKSQNYYRDKVSRLKPAVDSLRAVIKNARQNYAGIELKKFDSLGTIVDSFAKIDWQLQAYAKARELVGLIAHFNADAVRAKELRTLVPGEWVCTQHDKSTESKDVNAVAKKIFTFEKNGKGKFIESKKGQSGPFCKEDWEFVSNGTWDANGDTLHLFVTRFAVTRQLFERLYILNGGKKKEWRKEPKPTYDSAITDGSQDRFISYKDLTEDFEQTKKFK
jgi:hypothetical protein